MIRINLRGETKAAPRRTWSMPEIAVDDDQMMFGLVLGLVLLILAGAWWYQSSQLDQMRHRLQDVRQQHERLTETADRVEEIQARTERMRQKLEVIVELKRNQTGPVLMLDEISQRLADGLWLTLLEASEGEVNIQGAALSNTAIADFHRNLQASPYFDDVVLGFTEDTGDAVQFDITCRFAAGEPALPEEGEAEGRETTARTDPGSGVDRLVADDAGATDGGAPGRRRPHREHSKRTGS